MPRQPDPSSLRFVVLRHEGYGDTHFDVMYESLPGSALKTWRWPTWPAAAPVQVVQLGEHRREYLTYEGPVSNNRGRVTRVADGSCRVAQQTASRIVLELDVPGIEHDRLIMESRSPSPTWTGWLERGGNDAPSAPRQS